MVDTSPKHTAEYSNPQSISYSIGAYDFGAASEALAIAPPNGARFARVADVHVMATETFTATTTPAYIRLGTAADNDKYMEFALGTLADTNAMSLGDDLDAIKSGYEVIDLTTESITQLELNLVAPTGGTPAGIGYVTITVEWF